MTSPEPRGDERGGPSGTLAVCPLCKGAGYLKRYKNGVNVLAGSELVACDCTQDSQRRNAWEKARRNSGLPTICHDQTLGNYRRDRQPEAFAAATEFAAHPERLWLVLQGEVGTGKTHLAAAIVNRLLGTPDWRPLYYVVPDLLDRLRPSPYREDTERDREWKAIREASVLVLDDYGKEKGSEWADETLFKLLDYRYTHHLPLVMTTNLPFDDPDLMPPAIASRLQDRARSRVIRLRPGDYRRSRERATERDDWGE